jgi:hypothetical protein
MEFAVTDEAKVQLEEIARREGMTVDEMTRLVFQKLLESPAILERLPVDGSA